MAIEPYITQERFGYLPDEIAPFSTKPIIMRCDFCTSIFERKKVQFAKPSRREYPHSCVKCDSVKSNFKKNNPLNLNPGEFYAKFNSLKTEKFVDWELTFMEFGYGEKDISGRSEKQVYSKCAFCESSFVTRLSSLSKSKGVPCCRDCSALKGVFGTSDTSKDGLSPSEFHALKRRPVDPRNLEVEETLLKFGYDPKTIKPFSENLVVFKCFSCNYHFNTKVSSYTLFGPDISCGKPACKSIKLKKTLQSRYGVSHSMDIPGVKEKLTNPKSEQIVANLLTTVYGREFIRGYSIGPYSFDFFIPSANLLVECQGEDFHNFKQNGYSGTARDQAKATYVSNFSNHKLVWIWEHEIYIGRVKKILSYHLGDFSLPLLNIELDKIIFKNVEPKLAHEFLTQHHYLGSLSSGVTCLGAFYNDDLIGLACIGGVTRNEIIKRTSNQIGQSLKSNQLKEIRRFCLRPNVLADNLGSYCMSRFLKLYKKEHPEVLALISFSHSDVGDSGGLYRACNFVSLGNTAASYHYMDGTRAIHKKTVYKLALASKMKEVEFVNSANLTKVSESPKTKWLFRF